MRVYIVFMQGPEWNEPVAAFADPMPPAPRSPAAGLRAEWLRLRLEQRSPEVAHLVPKSYRDNVYQMTSRYVITTMETV